MVNWYAGWSLILAAFASGAIIGLFFHRPGFLGGHDALRRRMVRLGHTAFAALGMLNILFSLAPMPPELTPAMHMPNASVTLIVGGITMPLVCFLTAWKPPFRHLFFIPVTALCAGVIGVLVKGLP